MSATWNLITRALTEAPDKDSLVNFIRAKWGDDEADVIDSEVEKFWNPEGMKALTQVLLTRYADAEGQPDPELSRVLDKAQAKFGGGAVSKPQGTATAVARRKQGDDGAGERLAASEPVKRGRGRPPGSKNKSSVPDTKFVDPDQAKAQQAATAATAGMRPDRAGTKANIPGRSQVSVKPGEKAVHDVGTAGQSPGSMPGHTRPPQVQPSQDATPSRTPQDLENLRAKIKQLTARQAGLQSQLDDDPKNQGLKTQVAQTSQELGKAQQQLDRTSNAGQSGIEDMQKRVDYLTKTYPDSTVGDDMAKKLGVPTTKQRSRRVKDPETGLPMKDADGKDKVTVQIWNADKVEKFMNSGGDVGAGTYDMPGGGQKLPANAGDTNLAKSIAGTKGKSGPKAPLRKPMQKNPSTGEMEMRPGTVPGQRWKPHGVSQKQAQARPDQATGNFAYGTRYTNPAEEGQEVVWDGSDWVLPSQWAAKKGEMSASGVVPTGARRPWQSGAQNVGGAAVPNDANTQKAGAKAAVGPDKKSDVDPRSVKKTVSKAFDD